MPYFGVGLGLRRELREQIAGHSSEIDVLEITPEHYIDRPEETAVLENFSKNFRLIPHSLKLSIGGSTGLNERYLEKLKIILQKIKSPYHSDHFALTDVGGFSIGHLSPLWFTDEALEIAVNNVKKAQNFLELPLLLENITSYFNIPKADMTEAQFIGRVCGATGCGILLDLTNVLINSYNQKTDPFQFLEQLPLDKVVHIHLAGGKITNGWFYDTHSEELSGPNEGVWPLLEWVAKRADIKTVIIERDNNLQDSFEKMFGSDLKRARNILNASKQSS